MKKIWVNKTNSFKKAADFDESYYLNKSKEERLSDIQFCREQYAKMKGKAGESRKGLCRVFRIIKQKQG